MDAGRLAPSHRAVLRLSPPSSPSRHGRPVLAPRSAVGALIVGAWSALLGTDQAGAQVPVPTDAFAVVVRVNQPGRPLAPLLGVNRPPLIFSRQNPNLLYDGTLLFHAFGVESVRLHDARVDLCEIYRDDEVVNAGVQPPQSLSQCVNDNLQPIPPRVRWRPRDRSRIDDPSQYDFDWTDQVLASVNAIPARVYLRLGESFNGPNDTDDPDGWARVAVNIHRHHLGLFRPVPGLKPVLHAVEVHNEPDGFFWVGSQSTFFDLFRRTVDQVRSASSSLGLNVPVGGPGFFHTGALQLGTAGTLPGGFIAAVGVDRLDFLSVHFYGGCASTSATQLRNWLRQVRSSANAQGLVGKALHVSEWNIGLGQQCGAALYREPRMASFVSTALSLLHEDEFDVRAAHFYAGLAVMSLFAFVDGQARFEINPSAWAFWAHQALSGGARLPVAHCESGSCANLADAPERPAVVAVAHPDAWVAVLSNDTAGARQLRARFTGLPSPPGTVRIWTPPTTQVQTLAGISQQNRITPDAQALAALLAAVPTSVLTPTPAGTDAYDLLLTVPARGVVLLRIERR